MQTMLHKCLDFNLEIGAMTKLIQDGGQIYLFCAKGHSETAGLGIKYDWVVSNNIFRSKSNHVDLHMQGFLDEALDAITLTITRMTVCRARLYMRAYKTGMSHSHDLNREVCQDPQVPTEHHGSREKVPGEACGAVPGTGGEAGAAEAGGRDWRPQDVRC